MRRVGRLLGLLAALLPGSAAAVPLDLSDATSRDVLVEIEKSVDLSLVGVDYQPAVRGAFASDGTTGTVTVPGANLEPLYSAPLEPVPGMFSDVVIEIDLVTREAIVQPFTMTFRHATGVNFGFLTNTLDTTGAAGFLTAFSTVFCVEDFMSFPCQLVPGAPYDPATGQLNAVGSFDVPFNPEDPTGFVPAQFSPNGDLRISELPEPSSGSLVALGLSLAALQRARSRRASS